MVAHQVQDDSSRHELDALWRATQDRLRASVPESTFRLWLEPLRPIGADADTLYLTGPEGIRAWAERRYASLIGQALAGSGTPLRRVSFSADTEGPAGPTAAIDGAELNPNYTFERFVIGSGNRLAHGAALAVAEAPSEAYNPLFLHGPPGLGKTHLLAAIANYLRANAPGLSVRYTTAESFTNEFVGALKSAGAEGFKARYRDIDVLLIDDVQCLEGKPATEEEFFHTFNALYESGSQLVLSADRIPSELSTLASRLRDRFEWGLTVPVEPPNLATRLTVLRRLVQEAGVEIADGGALHELAHRIDANVRQLHGGLTRVLAHASLMARPLSTELIAEVIPRGRSAQATSVEEIQQRVAEGFGISRAELIGSSRAATPLRARQVAIFLTRELTDLSLPQIGRLYGGRDHSTVLNSLRRIEAGLADDSELADRVQDLRGAIHNPVGERG
ncbi:MAG TPA: chromosomal replication initiator protein DnaA [Solirubrobacterales bacterium]|jgi:chromosomal replication initiator protein|nr:chromosomal replication initiator protein DnaA [Solirubrobacterales bacterium]